MDVATAEQDFTRRDYEAPAADGLLRDADGRVTGQATYRVALELHDAARIGRIEVDADRWGALLETLRRSPVLVLALQCLARDYWSMAGRHPTIDEDAPAD